jgi:hypothetical protein
MAMLMPSIGFCLMPLTTSGAWMPVAYFTSHPSAQQQKRREHAQRYTAQSKVADLFGWNTGSTPGASKTFQPRGCGLISITVIASAAAIC